jgi:hypothetical protein
MAPDMKVSGMTLWPMEKVSSPMLMEISMRENGKMIRPMVMAYTCIMKEAGLKATGRMIFSTGTDCRPGLMVVGMRATIKQEKSMGKVHIHLQTVVPMRETGKRMPSLDMESIRGQMEGSIQGNG